MIEETKIKDKAVFENFLRLKEIIKSYNSALVAYSGGVDSTLLAYLSHHILAQKFLAVTVNSEFIPAQELAEAKNLAKELNLSHQVINISVLDKTDVIENSPLRCKYCKKFVFRELTRIAEAKGLENIFDGSNMDDIKDYRPGFEAIKGLKVKSPFIKADFTKSDIRNLAKAFNISNWNKPSLACLASRIPYDIHITGEILQKVEKSENYLQKLGYKGFRVRHHDKIARIELNPIDFETILENRKIIDTKFKELGYSYVCLDLKGYRTGSLNEVIL